MRYSIKNLAIGFECPIVDLSNKEWNEELGSKISDSYTSFFDILKNDLELLELPNGNVLFLYTLVAMVDNNILTRRQLDEDWTALGLKLTQVIIEYLEKQNIQFFRKLD